MAYRGIDSWSDSVSARERVREISTTLIQPRSIGWIQNEAQVSLRDRNRILRKWDRLEANKRLLGHALALYDDARTVDSLE